MRERHHDVRLLAAAASAGLAICSAQSARAQTADYFAAPWIVAPLAQTPGQAPAAGTSGPSAPAKPARGTSNLYNQTLASAEPAAPPVLYVFNLGVDEVGTDNVTATETDRVPDLSSLFSAGATVSADTERLSGVLSATGLYRRNINETDYDQFSEYGYGSGQATIIPGNLYMTAQGSIDDLQTLGGGFQVPLSQAQQNTHAYTVSGSPYFVAQLPDIGMNVLRYEIGQVWFSNNEPISASALPPAQPLSASTNQTAREDFRMAGTILPRLMTDTSLSGTENTSDITGNLQIANGEVINEYEVTRSASLIGGAGYEYLHDPDAPIVDGQGPIWDFGGRIRPNADSYALLIYGRHDLKSDFAGEVAWRITPITDIYAAYTDFLSTQQQSIISNNAGSVLGPDGAVTGVNFNQSTVIGVLDDTVLNGAPGSEADLAPIGVPVGTSNNLTALENGIFRSRIISGSARMIMEDDSLVVTAYDAREISLTPALAPSSSAEGAQVSMSMPLSPRLSGFTLAGYAHQTGTAPGDIYDVSIGGNYLLSDSLSLQLRYDLTRRTSQPGFSGYLQNAVTLGIHKYFL